MVFRASGFIGFRLWSFGFAISFARGLIGVLGFEKRHGLSGELSDGVWSAPCGKLSLAGFRASGSLNPNS